MEHPLPHEAASLFRLPPEGFTAARNTLSKDLADQGRTDDAARVKALRKPTLVVWALNQLVDRDGQTVAALLDAGRELRAAQQAAASTAGGGDRLRTATLARRAAVTRLVKTATAALDEAGHGGPAQGERIAAALETASIDPEVGERLAAGTLEALPEEPAGFGAIFGLASVPAGASSEPEEESDEPSIAELEHEVTRLRRERGKAETASRKQSEIATHLAEQLEDLERRRAKTEVSHAEAVGRLGELELEVKRLDRELARATEAAERRGRSDG